MITTVDGIPTVVCGGRELRFIGQLLCEIYPGRELL